MSRQTLRPHIPPPRAKSACVSPSAAPTRARRTSEPLPWHPCSCSRPARLPCRCRPPTSVAPDICQSAEKCPTVHLAASPDVSVAGSAVVAHLPPRCPEAPPNVRRRSVSRCRLRLGPGINARARTFAAVQPPAPPPPSLLYYSWTQGTAQPQQLSEGVNTMPRDNPVEMEPSPPLSLLVLLKELDLPMLQQLIPSTS
ncbi:uncharacterized protein LOC126184360 [Schistocerca cancellata]|uniref:uncharacterized protein LOC126184360 n=1 Tax=Schistocerca cancellata TaxID=274614 RepID=UPI0021177B50|nr:uncharacterized protein LOC126184360 [Schistocerca cancellata]